MVRLHHPLALGSSTPSSHPRRRRRYTPIYSPSPPEVFPRIEALFMIFLTTLTPVLRCLASTSSKPTRRRRDAIVAVLLPPPPPAEPCRCNTQQLLNTASQLQRSTEISVCQRRAAISTPFHPFDCCVLILFYKNAGGWLTAPCDSDFWSATRVERCRLPKRSSATSRFIFSG